MSSSNACGVTRDSCRAPRSRSGTRTGAACGIAFALAASSCAQRESTPALPATPRDAGVVGDVEDISPERITRAGDLVLDVVGAKR